MVDSLETVVIEMIERLDYLDSLTSNFSFHAALSPSLFYLISNMGQNRSRN